MFGIISGALLKEGHVIAITKENFQKEVQESKIPVVLKAYSSWCPQCRLVDSIFLKLSEEMKGKVKFADLDADDQEALVKKFKIRYVPTFIFFKEGKVVGTYGILNRNDLTDKINKLIQNKL